MHVMSILAAIDVNCTFINQCKYGYDNLNMIYVWFLNGVIILGTGLTWSNSINSIFKGCIRGIQVHDEWQDKTDEPSS